jgi:hypothetical protein
MIQMSKSLLSMVAAAVLLAGTGLASAQTVKTTTTTWTNEHGTAIRTHSTTKKYKPYKASRYTPSVGAAVPRTIRVYRLPATVVVPKRDTYRYRIINDQAVIVDRRSRKVVQHW